MEVYKPGCPLSAGTIIRLANRMLFNINSSYVSHSERTTTLVLELCKDQTFPVEGFSLTDLALISLFHTIGFFREDILLGYTPNNLKPSYFSHDEITTSRYVYGAYYLEYMTPLKETAECLLNFLNASEEKKISELDCSELYKDIIYLCARVSDFAERNPGMQLPSDINKIAPGCFNKDIAALFNQKNQNGQMQPLLERANFKKCIHSFSRDLTISPDSAFDFLKLLIYFFDFKSTATVKHIINTSCYAIYIGQKLNFSDQELETLFAGAILHDIGKICTPTKILESPGKLSDEDMEIMRKHVIETKEITEGLVPEEIVQTAYRHHEKLDGSGYPEKLSQKDLTKIQKVLTVADITSALADARSYKEEFDNNKVYRILTEMKEKNQIDPEATDIILRDFETIKENLKL